MAAGVRAARRIDPHEGVEHRIEHRVGNARPLVGNADDQLITRPVALRREGDDARGRRVSDRVAQHVVEDAAQQFGVTPQSQARFDRGIDDDLARLGLEARVVCNGIEQCRQIQRYLGFADGGLQPHQRQQLPDQFVKPRRFEFDAVDFAVDHGAGPTPREGRGDLQTRER